MRLKLTLERPGGAPADDLLVTVDTSVTVGELAAAIARCDPRRSDPVDTAGLTLRLSDHGGGGTLMGDATVTEAGLRSGHRIALATGGTRFGDVPPPEAAAATFVVESGPDKGKQFPLRIGTNQIGRGRGNDVVLTDLQVSKAHARVNVGEVVEVIDLGSANGLEVAGDLVPRVVLRTDESVVLGETELRLVHHGERLRVLSDVATYDYNRSPRIDVVYEGVKFVPPAVPPRFQPQRIPIIPLIAPVLLGCIMFAVTRQPVTVLFVALSPVMMLGNVVENRVFGRREQRRAIEVYEEQLSALRVELAAAREEEAAGRRHEHPATDEVCGAVSLRAPLMWSHRPDQRGFLALRLGLGRLEARNGLELPPRQDPAPGAWEALVSVRDDYRLVDEVPVVADLGECGSLGIAGPRSRVLASARAALVQLVGLHSPAEVVVAGVVTSARASDWDWLKWLPHVASDHSPLKDAHLVSTPGSALRVVSALEDLVAARRGERRSSDDPAPVPALVVLVEDDAPTERSRLVELAEAGCEVGVHFLWVAASVPDLPAACRTFLELDPAEPTIGRVGQVVHGLQVDRVVVEALDLEAAQEAARALSPVVDSGARVDDDSDLARSVSLLTLVGAELASSPEAIVDRWRTSNSLPGESRGARRSKDNGLRAPVGLAAAQTMVLDLREHGPHALVGGTTGSGKSEFLQTWVMAMALEHSPARVTFLFVDYKGGAAFGDCVQLPHSVGLVTDLSPHLVRRALDSLKAELHHRERLLQRKKAKDLLELERRGDPEAPPSLIIVVDEFAALATEVPEFVDGVVDVAQRGRSLGLHLILATQRPAGVIKDNLRANTNLRIALRVADEADSLDVVGSPDAALFDPSIPGRAVAKVGPGRLNPFQTAYVGGWTPDTPPPPITVLEELAIGRSDRWEEAPELARAEEAPEGPTDLQRLVRSVQKADEMVGLPPPRRPWLDVLAPTYDLARVEQSRSDDRLIYGILDDPHHQSQVPVAFLPDRDGNMAVLGTGGSGKSTFLRTLGVVAGLGIRGGPCHVYGIDFGARGLQMLESLPHVGAVVAGEDDERVQRLLRMVRATVDERAARYAKVNASSIGHYREAASAPDEPRILLLVDNLGAFRQAYEVGPFARYFDLLQGIAADGRPLGVHVVVSADRPAAIPSALSSVIQARLVLRMASESDLAVVGLRSDSFDANAPPGRGFVDDREVQVAVLGGDANTSRQAMATARLATEMARFDRAPAPPILRLPEQVRLADLPVEVDGLPVLGVADESLAATPFVPEDVLLIVGPEQGERTSVMASVGLSLRRWRPGDVVYLGAGKSPLRALLQPEREAVGVTAIADLARDLKATIESGAVLPQVVFLEDLSLYSSGEADLPLQELLKAARANGVLVVTDAETSTLAAWPLQQLAKAPRHGIALQPDQFDGDNIFKTSFPRVSRADFPSGRGFYVRAGVARKVQCALPELA